MKQKIYKVLSVMLTLAVILSTCLCAIGTVSAAGEVTYYVSPTGDDTADGLSAETPLASVDKAVNLANTAGYKEGDTVYVKVIHVADMSSAWAETAQITAHAFTLDISSNGDVAQLGAVDTAMTFNGPTNLSNIKMLWGRSSSDKSYPAVDFAGNDVVIGNGISTHNVEFNLCYAKTGTYDKDVNLTFTGPYNRTVIVGGDYSKPIFNKNVNVTVAGEGAYKLTFGSSNGNNEAWHHATKYYGAVNINLKSAASAALTFINNDITNKKYRVQYGENSAVQIINSIGADAAAWNTALSTNEANAKPAKYYIINNNSGIAKAVSFTDTVGKYNVDLSSAWTVSIADLKGNPVDAQVEDGVLDLTALPSGIYNINAVKTVAEEMTVYISPEGNDNNDGLTESTPVTNVNTAIAIAKDNGIAAGDTLIVKLIKNASNTANYWRAGGAAGAVSSHPFTLKITSAADKAKINMPNISLGGDTIFDNVQVACTNWKTMNFVGYDVEFINNATISGSPSVVGLRNNAHSTYNEDLNLYLGSAIGQTVTISGNYSAPIENGDINITIDNAGGSSIRVGAYEGTNIPIYNGNINFNIKNSKGLTLTGTKFAFGTTAALQFINSANISLTKIKETVSAYVNNAVTPSAVPYYIINNKSGSPDAVELTESAGQYKLNMDAIGDGEYTAVIKNLVTGDEQVIIGDTFTVTPGEYDLSIVDEYMNNGETITVFKPITLNLNEQKYLEKTGKIFIGWQKADGSWARLEDTYANGDVLTAKYIDFTIDTLAYDSSAVDFAIDKLTLTEDGALKLNMGFTETAAMNNIPNVKEKGVIWVATDVALGHEIRVDEPIVRSWTWDKTGDVNAFIPNRTLPAPNKVANSNSVAIAISDNDYNSFYTARGYIKYTDNNGIESIVYTLEESSSAYKVAKQATDSKAIYTTIIEKVKFDNEAFRDTFTETIASTFDKANTSLKRNTDTYDVFSSVSGLGDYIQRKRSTVITNTTVKETINLGWISDMHIFGISPTDVDKQIINALSTYRGSAWLRYPTRKIMERATTQMNYMTKLYDKIIVSGDIADNYSYGSYNAVKAIVADKSINGSVLMTTGNHEFFEETNGDIKGMPDNFTAEEKYGLIEQSWSNNPKYHAEILKTSKGEDNAMIILLDNGNGEYPVGTAAKLQASINEAKQKNIPVLIFQHIPMATYNETETKVYKPNITDLGFGTADNNAGSTNMNSLTKEGIDVPEVHEIIRKNYDVIKGVFCGHTHRNYYTEITALDESGNIIPDTFVPQFVNGAADDGDFWVGEVILKAECKHSFTNYVSNNDATCTANGTETAICDKEDCEEKDTRVQENSKLDHDYKNSKQDDTHHWQECDCGDVLEKKEHKYDILKKTEDEHWRECSCGKEEFEYRFGHGYSRVTDDKYHWLECECTAIIDKEEHNFKWVIDKAANCGTTGIKHEECTVCFDKRNENTPIDATGKHTYSNNCDTKCNVCNATRTIKHTYKTTTNKATTSKNGSVVKACSVCGKQDSKTTIYYAKKVKLSTTEYTYNGKAKKPSVKVYDYKGNKISSSNYEVSYKNNKKVGKATVTIKLKGKYSGTLKATFKILPKESKVEKLTAAKKSLKVKISKVSSESSGYEIQYSTSSKFMSAKTKKVTSYKTTSVTLKSLSARKTYYVRVRTYKTVDGKKYYSDWSSKKSKKTK